MSSGPDAGPPGPTQIRSQLPVRHHHELIADGLCLSHMGWIELSAPARSGITGRSGEEGVPAVGERFVERAGQSHHWRIVDGPSTRGARSCGDAVRTLSRLRDSERPDVDCDGTAIRRAGMRPRAERQAPKRGDDVAADR
jgi:hypothetical protein